MTKIANEKKCHDYQRETVQKKMGWEKLYFIASFPLSEQRPHILTWCWVSQITELTLPLVSPWGASSDFFLRTERTKSNFQVY